MGGGLGTARCQQGRTSVSATTISDDIADALALGLAAAEGRMDDLQHVIAQHASIEGLCDLIGALANCMVLAAEAGSGDGHPAAVLRMLLQRHSELRDGRL
jgi:hypothetical protein